MLHKALVYKNTTTTLPNWAPIHERNPRGYAYKNEGYLIHIYGYDRGLWTLSEGLTASEKSTDNLTDWVTSKFSATDISESANIPGEVTEKVWRPGLYYQDEIHQALTTDSFEQNSCEQALRILSAKLDDLFHYIEPDKNGLSAHSHKCRELLILACTEIESFWKKYFTSTESKNLNTSDYVKLKKPLFLDEFQLSLRIHKDIPPLKPFAHWSVDAPSKSLEWYDAYNKVKHDREGHFTSATLLNCINALAAAYIMFAVRFSPYPLIQGNGQLSSTFNQLFEMTLVTPDPTTFYIPLFSFEKKRINEFCCGSAKDNQIPWRQKKLIF